MQQRKNKIQIQLLNEKKKFLRLDFLPFVFIHGAIIQWLWNIEEEDDEDMQLIYAQLVLIMFILIHCLTYLLGNWSQRAKKILQYDEISGPVSQTTLNKASSVFIQHQKKDHSFEYVIIDLILEITLSEKEYFYFLFQGKKFVLNEGEGKFQKLKFFTKNVVQKSFFTQENKQNMEFFQNNTVEIPIKKFQQLLLDQIMEPFSFFQTFSVSLYILDDLAIFAVFMLIMLFVSACTVVLKRVQSLLMLRDLKLKPQYITTYRDKKWKKVCSNSLKPGDMCIINSSSNIKPSEEQYDDDDYIKSIPFHHLIPPGTFKRQKLNKESYKQVCCDFMLLQGSCVVNESLLTGESVPQIKDSLKQYQEADQIDVRNSKNHILYCGTEVMQATGNNERANEIFPENSVVGYVLKTGFDTQKGKLIRTVLYNTEKIQQKDPFYLIVLLLFFAIFSSAYVLQMGLDDEDRNKKKLFLRCIMIITNVVPNELPMVLTIIVNQSLLNLQKKYIYCTEPFRVPVGGTARTLCFDKTGTLTEDQLILKGIVDDLRNVENLKNHQNVNTSCQLVLAGCHSLVYADNKLQGDYIETLFFQNSQWSFSSTNKIASQNKLKIQVRILDTYQFKSELKYMATIAKVQNNNENSFKILVKGAPETIQTFLDQVPKDYVESYKFYSKQGYRVLAMASKEIQNEETVRKDCENNLVFCGFYICEGKLKKDSKKIIENLRQSEFKVVMITGDNLLTAINIGLQLNLGPIKSNQNYQYLEYNNNQFYFIDQDEKNTNFDISQLNLLKQLSQTHCLCIQGNILQVLQEKMEKNKYEQFIINFTIFARTSPFYKEVVVRSFKSQGYPVLMCGDGSNDVGALKRADIGIALVAMSEETEIEWKEQKAKKKEMQEKIKKEKNLRKKMQLSMEFQKDQNDEDELLNFGDACIAAPFTSKQGSSIKCVSVILRQCICSLVTTISTYKILALSSFIIAHNMTTLHLKALKFSNTQHTIMGITGSIAYFQTSSQKPLKTIYNKPPPQTIFDPFFIISLSFQIFVNWYCTQQSVAIGLRYSTEEDLKVKHDQEFSPAFLNTTLFLFQLLQQCTVFLFNAQGEPFMEGIRTKKKYLKMMLITISKYIYKFLVLY